VGLLVGNPALGLFRENPRVGLLIGNPTLGLLQEDPRVGLLVENPGMGMLQKNPSMGMLRKPSLFHRRVPKGLACLRVSRSRFGQHAPRWVCYSPLEQIRRSLVLSLRCFTNCFMRPRRD
jgi:hypothetical protein